MVEMIPLLNPNIAYIPVDGGVLFRGPNGSFVLKGDNSYQWMKVLSPYLTGKYHIEQFTSQMNAVNKENLILLLNQLEQKGVIRDKEKDIDHSLTTFEEEKYDSEIGFIESYLDSGEFRFQKFRNTKIAIVGNGISFVAAIRALLKTGLKSVTFEFTDKSVGLELKLASYIKDYQKNDPHIDCVDSIHPILKSSIESFDIVLYVADTPNWDKIQEMERKCQQVGARFMVTSISEQGGIVGPLHQDRICWNCIYNRLKFQNFNFEPQLNSNEIFSVFLGNMIAFQIFSLQTGISQFSTYNFLTVDPTYLSQEEHLIESDGTCHYCSKVKPGNLEMHYLKEFQQIKVPISEDDFNQQATTYLVSTRTGIFKKVEYGDLEQIPVAQCELTIREQLLDKGSLKIIEPGRHHSHARFQVLVRGIETYAKLVNTRKTCDLVYSVKQKQWITLNRNIELNNLYFTSGFTYDNWIQNGIMKYFEMDLVNNYMNLNGEYTVLLANKSFSHENMHYFKILKTIASNFKLIYRCYESKYWISAVVVNNKLISVKSWTEFETAVNLALLSTINILMSYEINDLNSMQIEKKCGLTDELIVVPWISDQYILSKLPIAIGWIGYI